MLLGSGCQEAVTERQAPERSQGGPQDEWGARGSGR